MKPLGRFQKNTFKSWQKKMWCIPPKQDVAFACPMEQILSVYKRALNPDYPVVCMDETSVQCVKEVRPALPDGPVRLNTMMSNTSVMVWRILSSFMRH